jgi:hypothetical protein
MRGHFGGNRTLARRERSAGRGADCPSSPGSAAGHAGGARICRAPDHARRDERLHRSEVSQPLASIITNGESGLRWLDRLDRKEPELGDIRALWSG